MRTTERRTAEARYFAAGIALSCCCGYEGTVGIGED